MDHRLTGIRFVHLKGVQRVGHYLPVQPGQYDWIVPVALGEGTELCVAVVIVLSGLPHLQREWSVYSVHAALHIVVLMNGRVRR